MMIFMYPVTIAIVCFIADGVSRSADYAGQDEMMETVCAVLAIVLGWCVGDLSCLVLEVERRNEDHADD
jgi:hypothetical protein